MSSKNNLCIAAVGDIMLGDHPLSAGFGVRSFLEKNKSNLIFNKVKEELKADIVFGNLENILSDINLDKKSWKSYVLRGNPSSVLQIRDAGFNILSLVNNHALEHGLEPLEDTKVLLEKNNINYIWREGDLQNDLKILNIKGKSFGFLGYSLITSHPKLHVTEEEILDEIKKASNNVDFLIISMHWGEEFINKPSPFQIKLAHKMVDAGVNIILGHHPHVIHGIEKYKGGLIAYSLGNFVADMPCTKESIILKIDINNHNFQYKQVPIQINKKYQPLILQGLDAERMIKLFDKLSTSIKEERIVYEISHQYFKEALENYKQWNKYGMIHIMKNFYRYRPRYLYQLIKEYLPK